jgi:tRNA pseudouridine38-40 synthase
MTRFKTIVGYDGTHYCGWQVQPNAVTVQGAIEKILCRLEDAPVKVHGSGRTDQGTHARGQVAHFDLKRSFTCPSLYRSMNSMLPEDIRIMRVEIVPTTFHARKHTRDKTYRYSIWNAETMPPTERLYHLHVLEHLDIEAMRKAAAILEGLHDFSAFAATNRVVVDDKIRTLFTLQVRKSGSQVTIVARGDGFIYKMVRSLAGWLLRVGKGEVEVAETDVVLRSRVRTAYVPTAPAHGLFLWNVRYKR